jgi:predicted RNase H-like HicB family nuclease
MVKVMTTKEYLSQALNTTRVIKENGLYCGVVEALPGVWAQAETEEELLKELYSCAKSWILARYEEGLEVPILV